MPAYRTQTVFTGSQGSPYLSTFYFDSATIGTATDAANAAYNFWNAVDANMSNNITWNVQPEIALFTNPETLAGWEIASTGGSTGGSTGDELPWQTQGLVRWSTGTVFNNRRVRGRTFIPGLTEQDNTAGVPNLSLLATWETAGDTLVGEGLVIASRVMNAFIPAIGASAWNQWAVLRSRRD